MKTVTYGLKICLYQLRILSKNYKIYTVPICLFIFMKSFLDPLDEFLVETGERVTPFLFPFFLNGRFCAALVFAGILLFFVDAPFYDKEKLFVMIRSGRTKWVVGQIFYIIAVSVGYMLSSQNGFGGIGIQTHVGGISGEVFVVCLGTDHGAIIAAKA